MKKIGLIINPLAGIGGPIGLKGSDLLTPEQSSLPPGELSISNMRAILALSVLPAGLEILTAGGEMGETAALAAGILPKVVYWAKEPSTKADTEAAVIELIRAKVDIIVFAGGDGTAKNICHQLIADPETLVLGIPTGVKMYSGCFANSPMAAGSVIRSWLEESFIETQISEVVDVPQSIVHDGIPSPVFHGTLKIPAVRGRTQARKTPSPSSDRLAVEKAARGVISQLQPDNNYILGPGGTTLEIAKLLGINKTPLGADVICNGQLVGRDCSEATLLESVLERPTHAILTIIGGQGFLLGRGNQQISANVIRKLEEPKIMVVATPSKLSVLGGRILIDSGDQELDKELEGSYRITTGVSDFAILTVISADGVN